MEQLRRTHGTGKWANITSLYNKNGVPLPWNLSRRVPFSQETPSKKTIWICDPAAKHSTVKLIFFSLYGPSTIIAFRYMCLQGSLGPSSRFLCSGPSHQQSFIIFIMCSWFLSSHVLVTVSTWSFFQGVDMWKTDTLSEELPFETQTQRPQHGRSGSNGPEADVAHLEDERPKACV